MGFQVKTISFKNLPAITSGSLTTGDIFPLSNYDTGSAQYFDRATTLSDLTSYIGNLLNTASLLTIADFNEYTSSISSSSIVSGYLSTSSYYIDSASFSSSIANLSASILSISSSLASSSNNLSSSYVNLAKYEVDSASIVTNTIFTNTSTTPVTIGGIVAGTTFASESVVDILNQLLYPYQYPTFNSFYLNGQTSPLEIGETVASGVRTFAFSTTNTSNIENNTLIITDVNANTVLAMNQAISSPITVLISNPITETSRNATYQWSLGGTNTENQSMSNIYYSVTWQSRKYVGYIPYSSLSSLQTVSSSAQLSSISGIVLDINQLDGNSRPTGTTTFNFSSFSVPGGVAFWLYSNSMGSTTFTQGGFSYPTNLITTSGWTNVNNINVGNYYLYISSNPTQANSVTVTAS